MAMLQAQMDSISRDVSEIAVDAKAKADVAGALQHVKRLIERCGHAPKPPSRAQTMISSESSPRVVPLQELYELSFTKASEKLYKLGIKQVIAVPWPISSAKVQSWTGFTSFEHSMTDAAEDTDP